MAELQFAHSGAESAAALDPNHPIIYTSRNAYTVEEEQKCQARFSELDIPSAFLLQFRNFCGKLQVSRKRGQNPLTSFHMYSGSIQTLDGVERLCHVRYSDGALLVMECSMTRGAHYSALFPLLAARLQALGLKMENGAFAVSEQQLSTLIDAANQVVSERQQERCQLQASPQIDCLSFSGKTYYYYKAYWVPAPASAPPVQASPGLVGPPLSVCLGQIESLIRETAGSGLESRDLNQLREAQQRVQVLKEDLDWCSGVLLTRIENLEQFQRNHSAE